MIKRKSSYETKLNENMRGGEGLTKIEQLLTPDELNNKGRLFALVTAEPGCSIGYHVHEGEMEAFYIISGEAEYDDNGETVTLYPGDTSYTPAGEGHGIKSVGKTTLEMIALIIFE